MAYIHRTNGTATNELIWTLSMWVKQSAIDIPGTGSAPVDGAMLAGAAAATNTPEFSITNGYNVLQFWTGSSTAYLATDARYIDPAAWRHIVIAVDTTQGTPADRIKMYVNGVEPTLATSTYPGSSYNTEMNASGEVIEIGKMGSAELNGLLSHVHFVDGIQYTASTFGEADATSGIWKIKVDPTVTYGNNGFFLKMEDRTNLDLDSSPNAHTMTTSGTLTATYDSPSNNFATMNPLDNYYFDATFSNGNNTVVTTSPSNETYGTSTLGLQAGLWYFEVKCASDTSNANQNIGITNQPSQASDDYYLGRAAGEYSYAAANGQWYTAASGTAYGDTYAPTDIIGVYVDLTASKLYFAKNGTVQNSGTGIDITAVGSSTQGVYFPAASYQESGASATFEFNLVMDILEPLLLLQQ